MTRVELPHDKGLYGPLRAAAKGRPELVRIGALIEALADRTDRARVDAARIVSERIDNAELFKLNTQGDATPVTASDSFNIMWPSGFEPGDLAGPESEGQWARGCSGALKALRRHWAEEVDSGRSWAQDECAWLAVLRSAAEVALPEVFGQPEPLEPPVAVPAVPEDWKPGRRKRPADLGPLAARWLELEKVHGQRATSELARERGVNRSTIQRWLGELVAKPQPASVFPGVALRRGV